MASVAPLQGWNSLAPAKDGVSTETASFSALQWSVIAMARSDTLSSLAPDGGILRRIAAWLGIWRSSRLADEKLEALRRISVLAWRKGYVISNRDLREFLSAGFTCDHYELLQKWVGEARAKRQERVQ